MERRRRRLRNEGLRLDEPEGADRREDGLRSGFDVVGATDGKEGLRSFHDERPDVVLLDLGLPTLDGWAVLERALGDQDVQKGDEIAVTFFLAGSDTTTLPLWILGAFRNAQSLPEVNAVATVILVISLPMIATAAYLMRDEGAASRVVQGE